VSRLTNAGQPDPSFSGDGHVVVNRGGADYAGAVAVQPDGAIVVAGLSSTKGGFLARYTTTGAPDASFSGDGVVTGLSLAPAALLVQGDGKIVVGGTTTTGGADFGLIRFGTDGTVDSGFGGVNGVRSDFGGWDGVNALALQSDGKIVAAGPAKGAQSAGHTAMRRYNADGSNDDSFAVVDLQLGADDRPTAVQIGAGGKILVAGDSHVGSDNDVYVARFTPAGALDQRFGIGGVTVSDAGRDSSLRALVLEGNGKPLGVGTLRTRDDTAVGLFRFQADGSKSPYPTTGFVLDGWGGLHGYSSGCAGPAPAAFANPYWSGWDIVRGAAVLTAGRGLVLDGWGGLHTFGFGDGTPGGLAVKGNAYWPNWDIARGVAVLPEGTGGYVLDGYGGLHPFALGNAAKPKVPSGTPYWAGQDIARGVGLLPDGNGGYVLDGYGGLHPFGGAPKVTPGAASWPGWDIARGVALLPDGSGGYVVDAWGGLHPFGIDGNAAPVAARGGPYWPGWTIVRGVVALP
jgi:uncharacterized delta-60 repeat protein